VFMETAFNYNYDLSQVIRFEVHSMIKIYWILVCLVLTAGTASAFGKKDVRAIIEEAYPGAVITEIEKEKYKGKKIYEVDFNYNGEKLEAIISLEGEIIKVGIDD